MSFNTIEKDWITQAGLRAVVIKGLDRIFNNGAEIHYGHRCGYVGVSPDHPAFNKDYNEQLDCISKAMVEEQEIGKKSAALILTAGVNRDGEDSIRRSVDILIDVHGGVTYAGGNSTYPVDSEENSTWWFGFDTAHYQDIPEIGGQSLEYCISECESMAQQLAEMKEDNNNV